MKRVLIAVGLTACLAACSGEKPEEGEGVFDPMVGTMDRAKGVEDLTNQRRDNLDEAEEASY